MQGAPQHHERYLYWNLLTYPPRSLKCGERLTRLDVSLPTLTPHEHAGENTWDYDVAYLLLQLPWLQHFAARNTPAGVLLFFPH